MPDDLTLTILRTKVRALVAAHQNLDAAAQAINDRWAGERVCKGTLSRRLSGDLPPPPIHHVIALEDELGIYPVTRWLARRMASTTATDVVSAARSVAKEAAEAITAVTDAALAPTETERARAVAEIDEAIEALRQARAALEAGDWVTELRRRG